MRRVVLLLAAEVLATVASAYVLAAAWQWLLSGSLAEALAQGAYLLFYFNDVAMAVWIVILVVSAIRRRAVPRLRVSWLAALGGVIVNVVMVTVIGFVQQGWFAFYVFFAIGAGAAFLVATLVVAPVVRRLSGSPV